MNHKIRARLLVGVVMLFAIIAVSITARAGAQGAPSLLLSWRADAYAPPGFSGKALPPRGGVVTAWANLLIQGKPADLSRREIRWFVGNELYRSGRNLTRVTFRIPIQNADAVSLKVAVLGTSQGTVEQTISIPVSVPKVVIDVPSYGGYVSPGPLSARAVPYFFSVSRPEELAYEWSANGSRPSGEAATPNVLAIDATSGTMGDVILLGVRASNPAAAIESAGDATTLTIR